MKENKGRDRPRNSFVPSSFTPDVSKTIISDDMDTVVKDKLKALIELYRRTKNESGYTEGLAFRVIMICLTSNHQEELNITDQLDYFLTFCLKAQEIQKIQLCFDLLLLKETTKAVKEEYLRLFKVRLLRALRDHYRREERKEERKKCGYTLQEYCKKSLQKDCLKMSPELYQQILDALIEEMKLKVSKLVAKRNRIKAVEQMTTFVGVLEKSERIVSGKYQEELMEAYWALARLHNQLHYLAYTKKYASIALNIAKRIQHQPATHELKALLDQLA